MHARGPDADGEWADAQAFLGHRRLSIIDLSPRSNQPLASSSGRYLLTYNGEVYNFRDLGIPNVPGDTLAILHEPPAALQPRHLRGMFAYGLWDRDIERLTLVRDRFGMKPLYYSTSGNAIAFGSTAAGVASVFGNAVGTTASVASYLRAGAVQGPQTIYRDVYEVDPGTRLDWTRGKLHTDRYWSFSDSEAGTTEAELRAVLRDSVAAHGVSDVPIALFLSGGVDSAVVGALATEVGLDITAFTLGFPGRAIDEVDDARETARQLGLKHTVVEFTDDVPDFDGYFAAADQPSIDGLNVYLIAGAAASAGFRVAMTGLGADELFAGYSSFFRVPTMWLANVALPDRVAGTLVRRADGNQVKAPELVAAGPSFSLIYDELRSVFSRAEVLRLTGFHWSPSMTPLSVRRPMTAVTRLELEHYLRNTLLRDADVFSMAHSLEIRTPFVDHHVLTKALSTGNWRRAAFRKRLLADAVGARRIRDILRKPKRGFVLPMGEWLRGPLAPRVDDLVTGPLQDVCDHCVVREQVETWRAGKSHESKIWALVVLDAWLRKQRPSGPNPSSPT